MKKESDPLLPPKVAMATEIVKMIEDLANKNAALKRANEQAWFALKGRGGKAAPVLVSAVA